MIRIPKITAELRKLTEGQALFRDGHLVLAIDKGVGGWYVGWRSKEKPTLMHEITVEDGTDAEVATRALFVRGQKPRKLK